MNHEAFNTPGQLLVHLLEERQWTQRALAAVLEVTEHQVSKLVTGRKHVTAEMALLFEEVFGVPADDFLDLQKRFELERARIERVPDDGRRVRARLLGNFPVREMINRGWLEVEDISDLESVERRANQVLRCQLAR